MTDLNSSTPGSPSSRRSSTGIGGLNSIMAGGLLNRATHLISGASGTGKTVLAQQIAFHYAREGHNVIYLTFLSESHEKMIANLSSFSFFDEKLVGSRIQYLSLYNELANDGLSHFASAAREAVLKYKAKLVVVEGVSSLRDFSASRGDLRKALFDFNAQLSNLGCTTLLLVDDEPFAQNAPEAAVADSILRLHNQSSGLRHIRSIEIVKARATAAMTGFHYFDITDAGLIIYPRIEALLADQKKDPPPAPQANRYRFGIEGLDQMIGGGLLSGSVNVLLGTPGSGKTLTGLHFVYEGVRHNEKTLVLSFHHSAERIRAKSRLLGFDLSPYMENGTLKVCWILPVERSLDEVVGQLLDAVKEYKPTRLFIDALTDLETLSLHQERLAGFWAALTNYLRNQQVTTLGTMEFNRIVGSNLDIPERPISIIADTILLLRGLEIKGQLKHLISVLEMRDSHYDSTVREYLIGSPGLQVGESFSGFEAILSGTARTTPDQAETAPAHEATKPSP